VLPFAPRTNGVVLPPGLERTQLSPDVPVILNLNGTPGNATAGTPVIESVAATAGGATSDAKHRLSATRFAYFGRRFIFTIIPSDPGHFYSTVRN
jgi:hypothetical protein